MEEEIDMICQRIQFINLYRSVKKDIWGETWMNQPRFNNRFDHTTQKWNEHLSIDDENYHKIRVSYDKYKALKTFVESFEAKHHVPAHYVPNRWNLEGTIQIYESNDFVVDLDRNYLRRKLTFNNFKFTPSS